MIQRGSREILVIHVVLFEQAFERVAGALVPIR